ncbi:MAG: hypothetical protein LAT68_02555 [Cyclobacteriaceae bacterium]|nr:hypothetical protein [Cyclobacteriaceae bacterium]MCH8515185.1 hypothetical protein [Cyclobacteriaceae bacterium]
MDEINIIKKNIYDNAQTHFLGNFPEDLPLDKAYIHIGIYLGWVIDNDLYSNFFAEEAELLIHRFKKREFNYTIISEVWDGYLGFELFDRVGNMFTYYYYGGGLYRKDYQDVLCKELPSIYHVNDNWENYELMSKKISERFQEWKKMIE